MIVFHVANIYDSGNRDENHRLSRARDTWRRGDLLDRTMRIEELPRNSRRTLGDVRTLPFIRDMVDLTLRGVLINPVLVLTNADTCLPTDFMEEIEHAFWGKDNVLCYSHRRNFSRFPKRNLSIQGINNRGEPFSGIDMVAFDKVWWQRNKFPDLLLGCEGWDWVFKFWPGATRLRDCVFHEYHRPYWMAHRTSPGEIWNKARCIDWLSEQGDRIPEIEKDWPTLDQYRKDLKHGQE
jgi:hypothetical protein